MLLGWEQPSLALLYVPFPTYTLSIKIWLMHHIWNSCQTNFQRGGGGLPALAPECYILIGTKFYSYLLNFSNWDGNSEKPSSVVEGKSPSSFRPDHSGLSTESPSAYKQGFFSEFIPSKAVNLHNFNMELLETKYVFEKAPVEKLFPREKFIKLRPGNGM